MVTGFIHQTQVEKAIRRAERFLAPEVVPIRYSFDDDWSGEPSVFFRILLTDTASDPATLSEVAQRISMRLADEARTDEIGLHAYFNFRSESEQAAIKDPAWA